MEAHEHVMVAGLFDQPSAATQAVQSLKDSGVRDDAIGIMMRAPEQEESQPVEDRTEIAEQATVGAIGGGLLGGLGALLIGVGVVVLPGAGPMIAGGLPASTLVGTGVGALAGGLASALMKMDVSPAEAKQLEHGVRAGRVLVTVRTDTRAADVRDILLHYGADIAARD